MNSQFVSFTRIHFQLITGKGPAECFSRQLMASFPLMLEGSPKIQTCFSSPFLLYSLLSGDRVPLFSLDLSFFFLWFFYKLRLWWFLRFGEMLFSLFFCSLLAYLIMLRHYQKTAVGLAMSLPFQGEPTREPSSLMQLQASLSYLNPTANEKLASLLSILVTCSMLPNSFRSTLSTCSMISSSSLLLRAGTLSYLTWFFMSDLAQMSYFGFFDQLLGTC